jgi:hypothetical protein
MVQRKCLLIITALCEGGIGLLALVSPSIPQSLLLGVEQVSPEASFFARIAGAALLALGLACWFGRADDHSSGQPGLLTSVLTYDVAAAGILASAGVFLRLVGLALWPAVVLHTGLAIWCAVCLGEGFRARSVVKERVKD